MSVLCIFFGACDQIEPQIDKSTEVQIATTAESPTYTGKESCAACHIKETEAFTGSHHDLAMQIAGPDTVLGDFDNREFIYNGIISTFFRKEGNYYVRTDGPEGKLESYRIKYTFGVEPLQQYLVEFPGGRLQVLGIAWDTRMLKDGGQRWFHLYPDEKIDYRDALHWTGINQNWNYMCAECHSTDLQKNYDPDSRSYDTRWAEIDVSCEACHGPGSKHIQLTKELSPEELRDIPARGLPVALPDTASRQWIFRDNRPIALLEQTGTRDEKDRMIGICARCHSRRITIDTKHSYSKTLHDTHIVSLLSPGLYQDDGQINDEVYVYGSFLQSKMYQAGVSCNDCHETHSLRLKREGNDLCLSCHQRDNYDSAQHHHHEPGSDGSLCVACHMPSRNYMVIDARADHSMRIPRPDLSIRTGTPNACNGCHGDQTPEWAQESINSWYNKSADGFHFAEAFSAARTGRPDGGTLLLRVINDETQPGIIRATALSYLTSYPSRDNLNTVSKTITAADPMIRRASLNYLSNLDPTGRYRLGSGLLDDPVKSVRIEAARLLAAMTSAQLQKTDALTLNRAVDEYIEAQMVNADRGFAHTNLGNLYNDMQLFEKAEHSYRTAIEVEQDFIPGWINLADLYRRLNREQEAETVLQQALRTNESSALLHHALGLSLIRQKQYDNGIRSLERAAHEDPDNSEYLLVYAIALNSTGRSQEAIKQLLDFNQRFPFNRNVLITLATMYRDNGDIDAAIGYSRQLLELSPDDSQFRQLLESLERKAGVKY